MYYLGGKEKIANRLLEAIRPYAVGCTSIIEPFCGGCSVTSRLTQLNLPVLASDGHEALITMWEAFRSGWTPPEFVSEVEYKEYQRKKDPKDPMTAFVGFGCSFAGKYFGGYARNATGKVMQKWLKPV